MAMNNAIPRLERSWRATAVSILTLLALLVAPVCAPFCAAQTCLRAQTAIAPETHCHAETAVNTDGSQIRAVLNCNSSELPVAALLAGNQSDMSPISPTASPVAGQHAVSQEFASILPVNRASRSAHTEPLRSSTSLLATGVLRI
jgi:hypothetical protein